ncbi:MAG: UDP-N-acetylmuramoyl-L-alanyl-D-glutamate--2,6-diaminopimelate ligase [Candidatus Omnitrophica bacterium]|nr:UDP-N-acetylmuramoyl-L-alanyl-D-glutamate--2,6-diaminopimelate ligase [Candidatus Omnitrophota bacterium]
MNLKELLTDIYPSELPETWQQFNVKEVCDDSRKAGAGSLFIACKGGTEDGGSYIKDAVKRGACIVICDEGMHELPSSEEVLCLKVASPNRIMPRIINRFYDDPSKDIKTIGVTGTNGKTTISYLLESIFEKYHKTCGVIGTISHRVGMLTHESKNTTPGIVDNYGLISDMVDMGMNYCVMEVSSHALDQGRVEGIRFEYAVFTNLTSDHLDYHQDREQYFQAKALLFTEYSPKNSVLNIDDEYGRKLSEHVNTSKLTYAINAQADIMAQEIELTLSGSNFRLVTPQGQINLKTSMVGQHNIYNMLAAVSVTIQENIPLGNIKEGIEALSCVPGRLERIDCGQKFIVFVDYAHTEDALKNVLTSIKNVSTEKIFLLFGCGGSRDKTKRPKMGKVASEYADHVILTNDNPRQEDPQAIIDNIAAGFEKRNFEIFPDREQAIKRILQLASKGNIVLIAGKGHEDYQILRNETIPFDDRAMVRSMLSESYG